MSFVNVNVIVVLAFWTDLFISDETGRLHKVNAIFFVSAEIHNCLTLSTNE